MLRENTAQLTLFVVINLLARRMVRQKNQIIAIPTTNNAPRIGENFLDLKLSENLGHTAALVRESLISFFAAFPRRVFDYRPVKVMCDEVADNL